MAEDGVRNNQFIARSLTTSIYLEIGLGIASLVFSSHISGGGNSIYLVGNQIRCQIQIYASTLMRISSPCRDAVSIDQALQTIILTAQFAIGTLHSLILLALFPIWSNRMPLTLKELADFTNTRRGFQVLVCALFPMSIVIMALLIDLYCNLILYPVSHFQTAKVGTAIAVMFTILSTFSPVFGTMFVALIRSWVPGRIERE